ncbi:MAG: Hsp20/alpha crystallin family protein [Chitinophagales bacterium]
MSLVKKTGWASPFTNTFLTDFFNGETFFDDAFRKVERMPAVNIAENEKEYVLEVAVPGMKKEHFTVEVLHGMLHITAEKKDEKEEKEKNYTRREFSTTSFSRMFTLPEDVGEGDILAEYNDGVLHLTLPKVKEVVADKKKVAIK